MEARSSAPVLAVARRAAPATRADGAPKKAAPARHRAVRSSPPARAPRRVRREPRSLAKAPPGYYDDVHGGHRPHPLHHLRRGTSPRPTSPISRRSVTSVRELPGPPREGRLAATPTPSTPRRSARRALSLRREGRAGVDRWSTPCTTRTPPPDPRQGVGELGRTQGCRRAPRVGDRPPVVERDEERDAAGPTRLPSIRSARARSGGG